MKRTRILTITALLILVAAWKFWPAESKGVLAQDGGDTTTLVNRIWIDEIPTQERDMVEVFAMLDDPTYGIFSKSSAYAGDWSSFEWSHSKGLLIRMLQTGESHKIKATVHKGAQCAPFDYCLRIKGNPRGAKRYGSMEDWIITSESKASPPQLVQDLFFE